MRRVGAGYTISAAAASPATQIGYRVGNVPSLSLPTARRVPGQSPTRVNRVPAFRGSRCTSGGPMSFEYEPLLETIAATAAQHAASVDRGNFPSETLRALGEAGLLGL